MPDVRPRCAIAVFAHNEERRIGDCLAAIRGEVQPGDQCFVIDNGSRDATAAVVERFVADNAFCRHVRVAVGDKANAWNVFCHDLAPEADFHVFTDGDCMILPGTLLAFADCLAADPAVLAAAGVPDERHRTFRQSVITQHGLAGNLYALSGGFVRRLRAGSVRLPTGLIGDDSLVSTLVCRDMRPQGAWHSELLATCLGARFTYARLSAFSVADIRLYYRRKLRYSLRRFQNQLLNRAMKQHGLAGIPVRIDELYADPLPRLRWRGADTWFDHLALRAIRRAMTSDRS